VADEYFTESQQESMLTLLCYDQDNGGYLASFVTKDHFEGVYRTVAERVLGYAAEYGRVPGTHTDDLFDDLERTSDAPRRLRDVRNNLEILSRRIHPEFVIKRAADFVRRQSYKAAITSAALRYQEGGSGVTDDVERILLDALKLQTATFDPGLDMGDVKSSLEYLELQTDATNTVLLGIPALDMRLLVPTRRQLFLFIAARKRGKTWFTVHCAVQALLQGWKVLHVSLEVNRHILAQRYHQALFGIAKRPYEKERAKFERYENGEIEKWVSETVAPELTYFDDFGDIMPDIKKRLVGMIEGRSIDFNGIKVRPDAINLHNLRVVDFPSGQLTMARLASYLDLLERRQHFKPDLLIVDYPDLMQYDQRDPRHALGRLYVDLRGLADVRDMALVVPTQTNRPGGAARLVTEQHTSEDISKVATADLVLTYTQSDEMKSMGVAELYVSNARNDEDRFKVSIIQDYATGQFVIDSARDPDHVEHAKQLFGNTYEDDDEEA
jgi:hypothetical protein